MRSVAPAAVPTWLWLHIPIAAILLLHATSALAPQVYQDWLIPEDGVIESITPTLLLLAILIALPVRRRARGWLRTWLLLFILGSVYFAGEEVSWGQRVFGWATPEAWQAINDQEETNFHNASPLLDSKPRLLVSIAVLIGGFLYPLSMRVRRVLNRAIPEIVWPSGTCTPAAILALTVGVPERIAERLGATPPAWLVIAEPGEVKELFLAFFFMLYALTLSARLTRIVDRR